jgi:hypothetical protein
VFEPDPARGADGMVSIADILDGTYRTRPGRGFGGGPCKVTVYGSDGTMPTEEHDTALFPPWTTELDLPRSDCTHDFTVPVACFGNCFFVHSKRRDMKLSGLRDRRWLRSSVA